MYVIIKKNNLQLLGGYMAYSIAICDDESLFCQKICEYLDAYQDETGIELEISHFNTGLDLLDHINNHNLYHIIILDVELGNINGKEILGTDIAKEIRKIDTHTVLLFSTNHPNFALSAFEVDALGYLLKPYHYSDLKEKMNRAIIAVDYLVDKMTAEEKYLTFTMSGQNFHIPFASILYIEKHRNQVILHTSAKPYTIYQTFKELKNQLDMQKFVQIHQGYIVNYSHITFVKNYTVVLDSTITLPVSRSFYPKLNQRFRNDCFNAI